MAQTPLRIEPLSPIEIFLEWDSGEKYSVPYSELRFRCPCAECVDEHTGERTIARATIRPDIRPEQVQLVGRYAIQFSWNDGHHTGMYHFDRLFELCKKFGKQF